MAIRPRASIAALSLICGLLTPLAVPASAGAADRGLLRGLNLNGVSPGMPKAKVDAQVQVAHRLHANTIRVTLPWSQFEPNGPGARVQAMVATTDRLMHDAATHHIKVIALLLGTPCWASTAPAPLLAECRKDGRGHAEAYPPADPGDFGAFTEWFAKRYGKQLAAIEIWNEPDQANEDYLAGSEKPRHYAELLKAAYPAIKRVSPKVPVLAGSVVGPNGAFMEALYEQGIKGYYDGVAVHFYTLVLGSIRRFREVQSAHGDGKPLWLDEFGWSSCWPKYKIEQEQGCVTKSTQAENMTTSFRELSRAPYVKALLTYGYQDTRGEEFGVLNVAGKRKPSFRALAKVLRSPFGGVPRVKLSLRASGGRVVASGSGPVGDYMKIEAFRAGRLRYEAIFTLDRFNRYSLKLPAALGTSGLTVRVYQYWLGPSSGDAVRSI